jgi:tetratricopeptide (TPR) repeat protein
LLRRGDVWASLPAVLAAGFVLAAVIACHDVSRMQLAWFYRRTGDDALENRDFTTARVCFERLTRIDGRPQAWWGLARAVDGLGEHRRAVRLLERAAPPDRLGYAPAHLERAIRLLAPASHTAADVANAEHHLRSAVTLAPNMATAAALLGRIYMETGRPELAVPQLVRAVGDQPASRLTLARAYQAVGEIPSATKQAELALKESRLRATIHPDEFETRTRWADAAVFLGDYPSAVAAFEQGPIPTGDSRFSKSLAVIYAAWCDATDRDRGEAGLGDRLELVERGLRADPASDPLLERLSRVLGEGGPDAERAREMVRDLLARGKATATAHFALGVDAWVRGALAESSIHFQEAERLAPGAPLILNNLAWIKAHGDPPDLPRALKLIELALQRHPEVPTFRGTRGVILARLERWRDALPDLEAALADSPDNVELHGWLASTYEALGDKVMAARHRCAAEQGRGEPAPSQRPSEKTPIAGGTGANPPPAVAKTEQPTPNLPPKTSDAESSPQ